MHMRILCFFMIYLTMRHFRTTAIFLMHDEESGPPWNISGLQRVLLLGTPVIHCYYGASAQCITWYTLHFINICDPPDQGYPLTANYTLLGQTLKGNLSAVMPPKQQAAWNSHRLPYCSKVCSTLKRYGVSEKTQFAVETGTERSVPAQGEESYVRLLLILL